MYFLLCISLDDKLIKRQIVRLYFSCDPNCNLNDPSVQTAILNKVCNTLKQEHLLSSSDRIQIQKNKYE